MSSRTKEARGAPQKKRSAGNRKNAPPRSAGAENRVAASDAQRRIRAAALDLFAQHGFASVSIKDIADTTKLNPALIYYYFANKEELFRDSVSLAVESVFAQFQTSREGLKHPREIISGWLDTHIREYESISKFILISMDYAKSARRKRPIDEAIHRFYDNERDVLRAALHAGIASGEFRSVDVEETATFISTYLDGVFARAVILKEFDPIASIDQLRSFLNSHLKPKRNAR
jgi:AcrR family transcriptional regulator